jgi:hypothetical protein
MFSDPATSKSCSQYFNLKMKNPVRHWWLTPIIRAMWEAEIGSISIPDQAGPIVLVTPSPKIIRSK